MSLDAPAFSVPRHNLSSQLPSELPADLLSAHLVWVWHSGVVPLSNPSTMAPMPSYTGDPAPALSRSGSERRSSP
jgi:hypothetical protein